MPSYTDYNYFAMWLTIVSEPHSCLNIIIIIIIIISLHLNAQIMIGTCVFCMALIHCAVFITRGIHIK
ncbi:hypothetical protein L1987_56426 [Smallanthus sonchifolius]|uniref:Uncharacterized protein n=1 Tax=Smallanthus sonchifolius TaxID=185202 RepID=A0ACB9ECE5_9ASTR|nr:hypothetical protein L1987_56426 [Smallanthus sonchifolius]